MSKSMNRSATRYIPAQTIEGQAFWEEQIKLFHQTDTRHVSRKVFCKQHQLSYHRFQYWYHKLVTPPLIQAMNQTPGKSLLSVTLKPEKHPAQHTEKRVVATILLAEGKQLLFHDSKTVSQVLSDLI